MLLVLAACLVLGCPRPEVCPADGSLPEVEPLTPSATTGYLRHAHAHNDYEHDRPLFDALDHGFHSVEADIWLHGDVIDVSHDGVAFAGTLRDLYLDPLQALVDDGGTVLGDGEPFFLWLDLKEGQASLRPALHDLLLGYDMLTRFTDDLVEPGAVTAILTGHAASKEAYIQEYADRRVCRDSNDYAPDDPLADEGWRDYSLKFGAYLRYDGDGEMDAGELERLRCIVGRAHELGRRVRFYATPETQDFWSLAVDNGVDFIGTDDLAGLQAALE